MKIKVLIADDETAFADALKERLELRGFDVFVVNNGIQAVSCVDENNIDVAVLDVIMPGLTGTEALAKIREKHPLVQVLLLTGQGTIKNAVEGMKLGAFDYLLKPADTDLLTAKLNDAYEVKAKQEEKIKKAEIEATINRVGW
ncbi:MAG: response regulator [Desulforegulaceae bacterium]|jgi:DNA-binding NtrC family response regulator|nr:response regulator [Desulforegulaceae bacterium]